MTDLIIPLSPAPAQTVTTTIGDQRIRLNVRTRAFGLFVDIYVNDVLVLGGILARNLNRLVRSAYLGFIGDLFFFDTQGTSDPSFDGLGGRFVLIYTTA
jgi:hypothetical protein